MDATIQTSITKADLVTDAAEYQICSDTELCLTRVDNYSGYGCAFPEQNASAKTTIVGLQNTVCNIMIFHTVLLLTHFAAREVQQWPMLMESTHHDLHCPEASLVRE